MIVERHQQAGSFQLRLRPGTPASVRQQLAEFAAVYVTPAEQPGGVWTSVASVAAVARWMGFVEVVDDNGHFLAGWGPRWVLGGAQMGHSGHTLAAATSWSSETLTDVLADLLPSTEPVHVGSITGGSITMSLPEGTARGDAVEQACALAGVEWRINPDLTIDTGVDTALFVTDPAVILLDNPGSPVTGTLKGVDARASSTGRDAGTYATDLLVVARSGDTDVAVVGSDSRTPAYTDPHGNDLIITRVVDAPMTPGPSAATVAANLLNLSTVRSTVTLVAPRMDVELVRTGDYLWVVNREAGLIDTANQVVYDGSVLAPAKVRLQEMSWGIREGMGVYCRTAAGTMLDLSPYVEREADSVALKVGRGSTFAADVGTVGMFGSALDATARLASVAPMGAWTPVVDGTTTDPTLADSDGTYRIDGGRLYAEFKVTYSATIGSGTYRVTGLPLNPVAGRASFLAGRARLVDASTSNVQYADLVVNDAGLITIRYVASATPGAEVQPTNALPWTWAVNDTIEGWLSYPVT